MNFVISAAYIKDVPELIEARDKSFHYDYFIASLAKVLSTTLSYGAFSLSSPA